MAEQSRPAKPQILHLPPATVSEDPARFQSRAEYPRDARDSDLTDVEVFNYAWDRKIVIVSPSTLLATLKTISSIWKQEKQNKYTLEIAEESGKLYDQFVAFVEDLEKVGAKLNDSQEAYNDTFKRLKTGNNNIFRQVDKLKDLGAKAKKKIPEKYLDGAESDGIN